MAESHLFPREKRAKMNQFCITVSWIILQTAIFKSLFRKNVINESGQIFHKITKSQSPNIEGFD